MRTAILAVIIAGALAAGCGGSEPTQAPASRSDPTSVPTVAGAPGIDPTALAGLPVELRALLTPTLTVLSTPPADRTAATPAPTPASGFRRINGTAGGTAPYAVVDEGRAVVERVDRAGGVVTAELGNGRRVHVIFPEGEVLETANVYILPYAQMPTSADHPPLGDEFGFGAYIEITSIQLGIRPYVAFDVSGGAAAAEIARMDLLFNRCDPTRRWFSALICGAMRGVGPDVVTERSLAVVSPIFNERFPGALLLLPVTPTGIDGLAAVRYETRGVYVPQRVDRGHAHTLVEASFRGASNPENRLEAAALALMWGLTMEPAELDRLVTGLDFADTQESYRKAVLVAHAYIPVVQAAEQDARRQAAADPDDTEAEQRAEDLDNIAKDLAGGGGGAAASQATDAVAAAEAGEGAEAGEAAATTDSISDAGVEGSAETRTAVQDAFDSRVALDPPIHTRLDVFDASRLMGDMTPEQFLDQANDLINDVLESDRSTIQDIIRAIDLAKLTGLFDQLDALLDKLDGAIRKAAGSGTFSRARLLEMAVTAQLAGLDGAAQVALDAAGKISGECDQTLKRTLANFGLNAVCE